MRIPKYLDRIRKESEENKVWVDSLSSTIDRFKNQWKLQLGNPYLENVTCSYVIRCKINNSINGVLKIGLPHEEAKHEIEGLKLLNGNPTVKVLEFSKEYNAILLERCEPGSSLKLRSEFIQDEIVCETLKEIWKANHGNKIFRPLSEMITQWNLETNSNLSQYPSQELALKGCNLREELINNNEEQVLLATDLHAGNILSSKRRNWLAIDIKPYLGDRTYDLTQHMLNCRSRLKSNPNGLIERLAKLAEVNTGRLHKWILARLLSENKGQDQDLAKLLL